MENLINSNLGLETHISLRNAKFDRQDLTLSLDFVCDKVIKSDIKAKIHSIIKDNIPGYIKTLKINIKRLYFDEEILKDYILKLIVEKHPIVNAAIEKNIEIKGFNKTYKIKIKCDESAIGYIEKYNIAAAIVSDLKSEFFESFTLNFEKCGVILPDEIIAEKTEEEPFFNRRLIKVFDVTPLCGTETGDLAFYINDIKETISPCVICGTLSNITKRNTKKDKLMYTFSIIDTTGKMRCLYFPSKVNTKKFETLKDGSEVILGGSVKDDNFNGGLCLVVNSISLCRLPGVSEFVIEKPASKKENKNYQTIFPEKMMQAIQDNLFETLKLSSHLQDKVFVAFDLETTGLKVEENHKITEIGAVKILNGMIIEKFSTLIDPEISIPPAITKLTGITDSMVKDKPKIEEVLPDFYKFTRGCVLVAHNVDFDFKFIQAFAKKQGYYFDNDAIDTVSLGRSKIGGLSNYKLQTLANALKVPLKNHHRAVDDAVACAEIFLKLNA